MRSFGAIGTQSVRGNVTNDVIYRQIMTQA